MFPTQEKLDSYYENLKITSGIEFTPREIDVIACILNGRTAHKEIADLLSITVKVIDTHKSNINRKLQSISKSSIRSFIEKSDKYSYLKNHYINLLHFHNFQEVLKKISYSQGMTKPITILYSRDHESSFLIGNIKRPYLISHLKLAGFSAEAFEITADFEIRENIVIIVSESFIDEFGTNPKIQEKLLGLRGQNVIFLAQTNIPYNILNLLPNASHLELSDNYYSLFFNLLPKLGISGKSEVLTSEFKENYASKAPIFTGEVIVRENEPWLFTRFFKEKLFLIPTIVTVFILTLVVVKYPISAEYIAIKSDLIIPSEAALLKRPEVISKIDKSFKNKDGIKSIVLTGIIGMGGVGKTTMARYYGQQSDASIVWELNSETKETLLNSFRDLSYHLANTKELKKELASIEQIGSASSKEKQLLSFIKTQLKANPNWLLIFDNMESFAEMESYFPRDPNQWGSGKVIITTRNEHIGDTTSYIKKEDIVHINELSPLEMLTLFSKIFYDREPASLSKTETTQAENFLRKIPPFPLEVSTAAYSIKNMHITFDKYLEHIGEYSKAYDSLQASLIKEATSYSKTRYGIISGAMDKLSSSNPKFKELLFFICSLDSQNIPLELLKQYKGVQDLEDFIYNLRKNSLLIRESYTSAAKESKMISIHRSTRENGSAFFASTLSKEDKEHFLSSSIIAMQSYYKLSTKNKDLKSIMLIIPHLNALLTVVSNTDIDVKTRNNYEADLYVMLGQISDKRTRNYKQALDYFNLALEKASPDHFTPLMTATILKDLGHANTIANHPKEAIEFANKSLAICETLPDTELIISANLQSIGSAYRKTNDFGKASESLTKAIDIIPESKRKESRDLVASIYNSLAALYMNHYAYKPEGGIGEKYLMLAIKQYEGLENFDPSKPTLAKISSCNEAKYIARYGHFLSIYNLDYDLAKRWVTRASKVIAEHCPENVALKSVASYMLGEISLRQNRCSEANTLLTQAINVSKGLGTRAGWTKIVWRAEARIRLGKFEDGYKDAAYVQNLPHNEIERNYSHDLNYWIAAYHAGFAQYKLKNYKKAHEHFVAFFSNMDEFCKSFLDEKNYKMLRERKAFEVAPYDEKSAPSNIKGYLNQALEIYSAIYGANHPFVRDYIAVNAAAKS